MPMTPDEAMSALAELGPRYMTDPTVAPQLLHALFHVNDAEKVINQAWLDCNWSHPLARNFLVDVNDCWDRHPEPLRDFIEVCHAADDPAWHYFADIDVFEDDPALAQVIYSRFAYEGPTDDVLGTMLRLRGSLESDHYADIIMPELVNLRMRTGTCSSALLKLWRRYCVTDGVDEAAIGALKPLLTGDLYSYPDAANDAVRVAECLRIGQLPQLVPALVCLAAGEIGNASRRARRLLVAISDTHLGVRIARAIQDTGAPWHTYMARLHLRTLWHMMDFMLRVQAVGTMQLMYNTHPMIAVDYGLFTRILCLDPMDPRGQPVQTYGPLRLPPATVHHAIYHMAVEGVPPPDMGLFHRAHREWPDAFQALARAPAINRELKWTRRKGLLLAMAMTLRRDAERCLLRDRRGGVPALLALAAHEAVWPCVLAFI